jgi:hypothetical protein
MGMYESLNRPSRDPYPEIPNVQSFREENTIIVSWSFDDAADEYYLFRAHDDTSVDPADYELVYTSTFNVYNDVFPLGHDGEKYLYRLGKKRGTKLFYDLASHGEAALGVVSGDLVDLYEPNADYRHATVLSNVKLNCNSYYFTSNPTDNIKLYDEDWYCVDIPSHWMASVEIFDVTIPAYLPKSHFKIVLMNQGTKDVVSLYATDIYNETTEQKRFYFRMSLRGGKPRGILGVALV